MKAGWVALAIALGALPVFAQDVDGEVRKIDAAQARLTLRHAEIKHLEMPAMTMVFRVKDPKMLEGLNVGDKVRFSADKVDGQYVVTVLVKQPTR